MKAAYHIFGLGLAAAPALCLFLAQSVLIARGQTEAVLALAQYGGLLGLILFVFDGQSGLAPAMLRLRHDERAIRAAYRMYRLALLSIFVLVTLPTVLLAPEYQALIPALLTCLLLRFHPLDHDLDRRDWQHWSMLAQNGWMIALAAATLLWGRLDPMSAGAAAVLGTLPYTLLHWGRQGARMRTLDWQQTRPALTDLLALVCAQGFGQAYGRTVLFLMGTLFSGPVAVLAIYAKQVFNAAGVMLLYLRRLELRAQRPAMQLSLIGQAGIALIGSIAVVLAAARLGAPATVIFVLISWQVIEKLSASSVYALQLSSRHDLAFAGLFAVTIAGAAGMALAAASSAVLAFVALETLGYAAVLVLWAMSRPLGQPLGEAGRP